MWLISQAIAAEPYPTIPTEQAFSTRSIVRVEGPPLRTLGTLPLREIWRATGEDRGQEIALCLRSDRTWRSTVAGWTGEKRFAEVRNLSDLSVVAKQGGDPGREQERCIRYALVGRAIDDRWVVDTERLTRRPLAEVLPELLGSIDENDSAYPRTARYRLADGRVVSLDLDTLAITPSAPEVSYPIDPPGPFDQCRSVSRTTERTLLSCRDPRTNGWSWLVCGRQCALVALPRHTSEQIFPKTTWVADHTLVDGWFDEASLVNLVFPEPIVTDNRTWSRDNRWTSRPDGAARIVGKLLPDRAAWEDVLRIDDCPGELTFGTSFYADGTDDVEVMQCVKPLPGRTAETKPVLGSDAEHLFSVVIDRARGTVWRTPYVVRAVYADRLLVLTNQTLHDADGWFHRAWTVKLPRIRPSG